ncbi:MAG: nucleoside monophosphate kinase [Clostridia bacterium]|nr:nucleoside monophosphate kinase [Clostridia bacterium]
MRIAILGPPGSGKGTQTHRVAEKYGLKHIVVGDAVKQEIHKGTELGKIMFEYTNQGKFVPVEIVMQLLKEQVEDLRGYNGFIIDTAPINMDQYEAMKIIPLDAVLSLKINDFDILRNRILKRLICLNCKYVTSIEDAPDMVCPRCGATLEKRYDDKIETINIRIGRYENETVPVIENYRKQDKLLEINAENSKEKVFDEICEKIDIFFKKSL